MSHQASLVSTPRSAQWGMSLAAYKTHVAEHGPSSDSQSPMRKYIDQRRNAHKRGLQWNLCFADWWEIWVESGKWALRARGSGYMMARHGDGETPYSKETVYICTGAQNITDSFVNTPHATRNNWLGGNGPGRIPANKGRGKGWTFNADCGNNPYRAQFGKKTIGYYPTAELARAAYLSALEASKPK